MGKTSNFCVVAAQLHTQGKGHGVHMFIVQIRSMEDRSVMPGQLSPLYPPALYIYNHCENYVPY